MIKLSAKGIEISHPRYISDSATGLFFIFSVFILEKYWKLKILGLSTIISSETITDPGNIVAFIFIFLLHPAIGLLISFFSWLTLEIVYIKLVEKFWFKYPYPIKFIQFENEFNLLKERHSIDYNNWHGNLIKYEEFLMTNEINLDVVYLRRSIRLFLRNIAFILIILALISIFNQSSSSIILIIASVSTLFFSGSIGFFSNLQLFFKYDYKINNQ